MIVRYRIQLWTNISQAYMLAAAEAAVADLTELTLACLIRGLEEELRPEARRAKYRCVSFWERIFNCSSDSSPNGINAGLTIQELLESTVLESSSNTLPATSRLESPS